MNRKILLASATVLSLLISFAVVDSAYALSGTDPNAIRRLPQRNFRRPVGIMEKYRRNKRSLERRDRDRFTAPLGTESTFERRQNYLRDTQRRRIQEDLDARGYTGISRADSKYRNSDNRAQDSILRRIRRAERGGLRLRAISSPRNYSKQTTADKRARAATYRKRIVDTQIKRYIEMDNVDCSIFSGRRQAKCYYRSRTN